MKEVAASSVLKRDLMVMANSSELGSDKSLIIDILFSKLFIVFCFCIFFIRWPWYLVAKSVGMESCFPLEPKLFSSLSVCSMQLS